MNEAIPQPQPQEQMDEGGYDREAIKAAAAETAREMVSAEVTAELPEERFLQYQTLMEELEEDNGNRFIVEAVAQMRSREKKVLEVQSFDELFPLAKPANDNTMPVSKAG